MSGWWRNEGIDPAERTVAKSGDVNGDVHGAMENRGTTRFCSDGSCLSEKILALLSLVSSGVNSLDRNLQERRESRLCYWLSGYKVFHFQQCFLALWWVLDYWVTHMCPDAPPESRSARWGSRCDRAAGKSGTARWFSPTGPRPATEGRCWWRGPAPSGASMEGQSQRWTLFTPQSWTQTHVPQVPFPGAPLCSSGSAPPL